MKRILFTCFLWLAFTALYAVDLRPVTEAFTKGNTTPLRTSMDTQVDMYLPGNNKKCAAAEALNLLDGFFKENKPAAFTLLHNADKKDTGFSVGSLDTSTRKYRVNLTYRIQNNAILIQSIRIE